MPVRLRDPDVINDPRQLLNKYVGIRFRLSTWKLLRAESVRTRLGVATIIRMKIEAWEDQMSEGS